jgi:hypothetical protein
MNTAVQYEYQLSIDSFTPNSGGTGGKEKSRERDNNKAISLLLYSLKAV